MLRKKGKKYKKDEVEEIVGLAINMNKQSNNKENIEKAEKEGLNKKAILKSAKKYKTLKNQKEKLTKKDNLKESKEKRSKKLITLYIIYFIVWFLIITALLIPFFIKDAMDKEKANEIFGLLWLFVMIGTSIVGLVTGIFIADLEGIIWGFLIGAVTGLGLYFFLWYVQIGRLISAVFLSLAAVVLFFFFKKRFERMVKQK